MAVQKPMDISGLTLDNLLSFLKLPQSHLPKIQAWLRANPLAVTSNTSTELVDDWSLSEPRKNTRNGAGDWLLPALTSSVRWRHHSVNALCLEPNKPQILSIARRVRMSRAVASVWLLMMMMMMPLPMPLLLLLLLLSMV